MAKKKEKLRLDELRGADRAFQVDRDTLILFTGRDRRDIRPFVRVGAGTSVPTGLLRHIENVILAEKDPPNAATETAWIHATVADGNEVIRYVGSKDIIQQIYNFSGIPEMREDEKPHVELVPFEIVRGVQEVKGRSTTTLFGNGNFSVSVGGTRVLDFENFQRGIMNADKEHDLISSAVARRAQKCGQKVSFLAMKPEAGTVPLFWNFNGQGVMVNPPADPHYRLMENVIDPRRVSAVIGHSPYLPGVVEFARRRHTLKGPIAINGAGEKLSSLKRIYNQAKVAGFEDARSIPTAKEASFFSSRTRSHGAFVIKMGGGQDANLQFLFPLGPGRKNKGFEYLRGPHDVEISLVETREDFKEPAGRLMLHMPAGISDAYYQGRALTGGAYPLVSGSEYVLHHGEAPGAFVKLFLAGVEGTPYEVPLREIVLMCLGVDFESEKVDHYLQEMKTIKAPYDVRVSNNVRELIRFLPEIPGAGPNLSAGQKKELERIFKQHRPNRFRVRDWLGLGERGTRFHILAMGGKKTYHLAEAVEPDLLRFAVPPSIDALERDASSYKMIIRRYGKVLDRGMEPPGYRACLEVLEKMFEERLRLVHERQRLYNLLDALEIGLHGPEKGAVASRADAVLRTIHNVKAFAARTWQSVRDNAMLLSERIGSLRAAALFVVAGLALVLLSLGAYKGVSAVAANFGGAGRSAGTKDVGGNAGGARGAPVALAEPGTVEDGAVVPGEDQIEAVAPEVYDYANALAISNGFAGLPAAAKGGQRNRDPNLVFPGDTLRLPDGRLVQIRPGQSIWEISEQHYKRDFARFQLLDAEVRELLEKKKNLI